MSRSTLLRSAPGTTGTAFERTVLPDFARWLLERIEDERPDYLIPAETKGARLLETVLAYLRKQMGREVDVPVLYVTALPYIDPGLLTRARVMIVDDAVRTGRNLQRHRRRIERHGCTDIVAVSCIGYREDGCNLDEVECFEIVEEVELYREYAWQLTELVVTRGLPPEVDHHVLTLRLPGRLSVAWPRLCDALARHGPLSVDEAPSSPDRIAGVTLHFPTLPGTREFPTEGPVRIEGVNKVRLFPDACTGQIYVVPVSFPALELVPGDDPTLTRTRSRKLVEDWTGSQESVGTLLVERLECDEVEATFRILSTCTELDLLEGLARLLKATFPGEVVSLVAQRELFQRLYGQTVGALLAKRIDGCVQGVLAAPGPMAAPAPTAADSPQELTVDEKVASSTRAIAEELKRLYEQCCTDSSEPPSDPVGRSLSEIAVLCDSDELLASRCLDFGLAMTTLVPYVHAVRTDDGFVRVRREYRVSETNRDPDEPYRDLNDVQREVSEEVLAFIAERMHDRSRAFAGKPIPARLLGWIVAALRLLMLERHGIHLQTRPGVSDPDIVICEDPKAPTLAKRLLDGSSETLRVHGSGIMPTASFRQRCADNSLRIDRRGSSVELEMYMQMLIGMIDTELEQGNSENLITAWGMSADGLLGLTYVGAALEGALDGIEAPLRRCRAGERHDASSPREDPPDALAQGALTKLVLLRSEWAAAIHDRWKQPNKMQWSLIESLAAPRDAGQIFDFASAIAELVSALGLLAAWLERSSAELWRDECETAACEAATASVLLGADTRRALTSLAEDGESPTLTVSGKEAVFYAAGDLLDLLAQTRAFVAALAGSFRGPKGERLPVERERPGLETILLADLAGSKQHGVRHRPTEHSAWKNAGLNLIAQWGRAFGAMELRDRDGDAVWLGFDDAYDAAALCAAAVEQHVRALRSTGHESRRWSLHVAVDHGQLDKLDSGNLSGLCMDRARVLADHSNQDSGDRALLSPDAADLCSAPLREQCMQPLDHEVRLDDLDGQEHRLEQAAVTPRSLDDASALARLSERIRKVAGEIARRVPAVAPPEPLLDEVQAEAEDDADGSLESSA